MSRRSPSGRFHNWGFIVAELQSQPGAWAIRLVDQPARLVRTVKDRAHPALHLEHGVIEAQLVNSYHGATGRRRGDVYLRYVPYGSIPTSNTPTTPTD